jgi:hypothetical protein
VSDPELARLRRDVDVIQEAAGLTLPFEWRDVWLTLAAVPCGLVPLVWGAAGPLEYAFVSLIPLVLLAVVAAGFQASRHRRLGRGRALTNEWISVGAVALAFAVLIGWEKWLGLPAMAVRGAGFILAGAMCFVLALTSRQRRVAIAATAALVPFGIALPLCSPRQVVMVGGAAVMVAGLVGAGILAGQLRAERGERERAAD